MNGICSPSASDRTGRVAGNCSRHNSPVLRDALLEGAGIGLLPAFLVADDIDAGSLRIVLPGWTPESRTLYAVFPQPCHPSPRRCASSWIPWPPVWRSIRNGDRASRTTPEAPCWEASSAFERGRSPP